MKHEQKKAMKELKKQQEIEKERKFELEKIRIKAEAEA